MSALSLRFNHEGFAMDIKLIAKPLARPPSSPPQAAVLMAG
jgi:hypothetical protein